MRDLWEEQLFECSFGNIRIDVKSTQDSGGRVLATHLIPHREGAPVRDQGAEPRVTRCRIIFFQVDDADDPRQRFYDFKDAVDRGETQTFVHPITGRYRAKVGEMSWSAAAEPRNVIEVECAFHEDSEIPASFEAGPGMPILAGVDEVAAAAAEVDAGVDEVNAELDEDAEPLETDVGDDAVALAQSWADAEEGSLTERDVHLALVGMSNTIQQETDRLELALHPERQPIMRALSRLHYSLRRAADAVIVDMPRLFEITIEVPISLIALVARTYPGEPFEPRVDQLLRLNDIPNPARIEAGTRLKAYSRTSSARLRSPRLGAE